MAILKQGTTIGVAVHHSVYKPANNLAELKVQAGLFDSWHKSKSWAEDIKTGGEYGYQYVEYHYLMATDGSILQIQDEKYVLYHSGDNFRGNASFNLHGIAICLTGNYENDVPNDAQMKALVLFIRDVQKRYKIDAMVRGHKETSQTATACPGKNIGTSKDGWLKQVITNVNDATYPPAVVEPPSTPNCDEYIKKVEELQGEIENLRIELGGLESESKLADERVAYANKTLKTREAEYDELKKSSEAEIRKLQEDLDLKNETLKKVVSELSDLKLKTQGWIYRVADTIYAIFEKRGN